MRNIKVNMEEYKALRAEILQYLQNFQNIRNMMYVLTLTMIGFFINKKINALYFLTPSIIILPSYYAMINYWHCAMKMSTYIEVFLERNSEEFRWETESYGFGKINKRITKIDTQTLPYIVMQFFCILLYFINIDYKNKYVYVYIIIGVLYSFLSGKIFSKYKRELRDEFIKSWEEIKDRYVSDK